MKERLWELKRKNGALIAAHRGTAGGSIVFNTIPAYENALRQGADIVEMDAARTRDGVFYCFHNGKEPALLGVTRDIRKMDAPYVDQLFLRDSSMEATLQRVNRLEEVFARFKGRCVFNVDRSWFYWEDIIALIQKTGMEDQVILKSPPKEEYLDTLERMAPGLAYMPILKHPEEAALVQGRGINFIMAELVFDSVDSPLVEDRFISELKKRGILLWGNVIKLDDWTTLSGGKDDYRAIMEGPEEAWGWCLDKGFDVLQTDWPLLLRKYINQWRKTR